MIGIVAALAAIGAGAGAGFVIGKRKTISAVQRALTAKLNRHRNLRAGDGTELAEVLAIVDKIAALRNEELAQQLTAARADIADMASVALEQKLVRRIDEEVQSLKNIQAVLETAVHRICEDMREDVKGCIAYQVTKDEPIVVTTYGIDEQTLQTASTKALISMLPTIVANRDGLVWAKSDCDHLKIPMPSGTETIFIIPLAQADRFIGCILAFSASGTSALGRMKRTFKGVMEVVSRAAYRAVLSQELQETQYRDVLTGLSNRPALIDTLTQANHADVLSMILVDGCNFADLNDRLGRSVADGLVKVLAEVLAEAARKQDVIYRTSAAQFAILLRDTDPGTVQRIAERVLQAVATREHWPGHLAAWNASCAVAHSTECGGAAKLLETADDVMLYIRENKFDGRIVSASQVPGSFFARRKKSAGISGSMPVFNAQEILETCARAEKPGVLRITPTDDGPEFWAYFEFGGINKARCGKLRGDDAVIELLTMFDGGSWKFHEATADALTGTTDDVSQLGRSYTASRPLEEVLVEAKMYRQHMQQATGLIPTANLYVMANPESETASSWDDLRTVAHPPSVIEISLMTEMLKLCNGQFKLAEVFAKLDGHPTARVRRCAALMLRHRLIRLNSLKVYARGL